MSTRAHKARTPRSIDVAIVTVSSTRGIADDKSGRWMKKNAGKRHRVVFHEVVPDNADIIADTVRAVIYRLGPQAVIVAGGTGVSPSDVTIEAIRPILDKELTAFGHLFAMLSFEQIDSAAIASRATAGIVGKTLIFCIPGSLKACKLACKELIFPELGHLVKHMIGG